VQYIGADAVVYPSCIPTTEILFATDFSEPSRRALACARQIARRRGAMLRALHVVDLMSNNSAHSSFNAAVEAARRTMRVLRRELRLGGIRENATIIPAGSVSLAIRDAAVRYRATMLIMGLHGEAGITMPTFGGNVRRLFRSTPCPLLTIGLRGPGDPAPAFERVLYITDMSAESAAAAQDAWPLDAGGAAVAHFSVLPPDADSQTAPPLDVPPALGPLRVVAHHQAAGLILAKATEASAGLIVMSFRGNGYLDTLAAASVARAILSKAACPVLVARASSEPMMSMRDRFAAARDHKTASA
jgi:nucleotide-binding universal stress UspA family protein